MKVYIVFYEDTVDGVFTKRKFAEDYINGRGIEFARHNITGESYQERKKWMTDYYSILSYELDQPLDVANTEPLEMCKKYEILNQ